MTQNQTAQLVEWLETACLWEATAPKAGNVHPNASFDDLCYDDFVRSARITAFMLSRVETLGVSQAILDATRAVQLQIGKNTNLGIILLLGVLAAVPFEESLNSGIGSLINKLNAEDSCRIYEAINLAKPGGLSTVNSQDLDTKPTLPVREIMTLAQEQDMIARQYANNFEDILGFGLDSLSKCWTEFADDPNKAIVGLHLDWLAHFPDSLIARKCGSEIAAQASEKAKEVLDSNWPHSEESLQKFQKFDNWLRADQNKRNPGTSADLVAGTLFAAMREGIITTGE